MVCEITTESEHGSEVYLDGFVPVGVRERVGRLTALNAGTVYEDVNAGMLGDEGGDEGGDGGGGREVADSKGTLAAETEDFGLGFCIGIVALKIAVSENLGGLSSNATPERG